MTTTMNKTTDTSPSEPAVDFEIPALLHSLREHKDLSTEDVRRESIIRDEAEKKLFKNHPICKFARNLVLKYHFKSHDVQRAVVWKIRRYEDRHDKKKGMCTNPHFHFSSQNHHRAFSNFAPGFDHDKNDPNHDYCWANSRNAARNAQKTNLHLIALGNDSTEVLQLRRARDQARTPTEKEVRKRTASLEVCQLVEREVDPAVARRHRARSNATIGTLEPLLGPWNSSTTVATSTADSGSSSPTTVSTWRWSNDATVALPRFRKSCMRYPKTSEQEAVIVAAAEAVEAGEASPYLTRIKSRRLSSLSQGRMKIITSVSYPDGCGEEIGYPTIEGVDGAKRPRLVVFKCGQSIDEMIPGKSSFQRMQFSELILVTEQLSQRSKTEYCRNRDPLWTRVDIWKK